jgi:hypothetical protein
MKSRPILAAVLVVALGLPTLGLSSLAHAEDAVPPLASSLTGGAKDAYESGRTLYGAADYAGALVKFKLAYETSHDARLLWNMAACEKSQHHYAKALPLVRRYLAEGDALLGSQDKADADELVKVMEPLTAKLTVTVDEPGAEVAIDGEPVGTSPITPVTVDIGTRHLRVRKAGFEEYTKEARIEGGAPASLDVKLVKIVHEGRLTVKAQEDATIALDGKVVGSGTWSSVVPSGGHILRVTAPKRLAYQSEVVVQDHEGREVGVSLEPEPSRGVPLWVWVGGAVVVAGGLTVGGYFLFKPTSTYEGPAGNLPPGIVQASWPHR